MELPLWYHMCCQSCAGPVSHQHHSKAQRSALLSGGLSLGLLSVCPHLKHVLLSEPRNVQDVPVPQPGLQQLYCAAAADKLVRASVDSVTESV